MHIEDNVRRGLAPEEARRGRGAAAGIKKAGLKACLAITSSERA
jgi:hypothetical protein